MRMLFGDNLSDEVLAEFGELIEVLEEITFIKEEAKRQGSKKQDLQKITELRSKFKERALEVFRAMYGFYGAEKGGGPSGIFGDMIGSEPLTAQDKRILDKQLSEQIDTILSLVESMTSMEDKELENQLLSLLGASGQDGDDLVDWMQDLLDGGSTGSTGKKAG